MAWRGGFTGRGYTRSEFREFLRSQAVPSWIKFLVVHNTAAPYIIPPVAPAKRIQNLGNYYKNDLGWSSGPNLVAIYDKIYTGTPLQYPGTNSPGFNGKGLGIEVEGDYDGTHNPKESQGLVAWQTASWGFAELLDWLKFPLDDAHFKLHREDTRTTHQCPGKLVTKPWLVDLVRAAQGVNDTKPESKPTNIPKPVSKQIYDVKTIQERLLVHGYSLPKYGADGLMGAETRAAIEKMQAALGITPSGLVGPWMWEQLNKQPPAKPVPKQPEPVPVNIPPVAVKPEPPIVAPNAAEPNPAKAMRLLQTVAGWPKHWAAGAIAQAQRESYPDLRPWAQGDWFLNGKPSKKGVEGAKPTAFGIWQLRDDRYDNFLSFASARGKHHEDFETRVLWCPQELKTSEKLAWRWLQLATNVEQACAAMVWYERPKGYIAAKAKAATTWDEVFAVSEKCDGWDVRLKFAKALM